MILPFCSLPVVEMADRSRAKRGGAGWFDDFSLARKKDGPVRSFIPEPDKAGERERDPFFPRRVT